MAKEYGMLENITSLEGRYLKYVVICISIQCSQNYILYTMYRQLYEKIYQSIQGGATH